MYNARIIKLPERPHWLVGKYEVGDVVEEVSDWRAQNLFKEGVLEPIEHYRIVTIKREKCKECGALKIVRERVKLNW